jgi:hypothetical protein
MNTHVPESIRNKYPNFDFRGKKWIKGGLTWIRGYHRTLYRKFYFCIELECGADERMYQFIVQNRYFA